MTATLNASANGQGRKTLATQLDRLDRVLDGLADGLNDAVADAVKAAVGGAVREAVQAALAEVLANPALVPTLRPTEDAPASTSMPLKARLAGLWQRAQDHAQTAAERGMAKVQGRQAKAGALWQQTWPWLAAVWAVLCLAWRCRKPLLVAVGFGLAVGIISWVAGPWVGTVVGGAGASVIALAVQAGFRQRSLLRALTKRRLRTEGGQR